MPDSTSATPDALSGVEVRKLYNELRGSYASRNEEYRLAREAYNGVHWDGINLVAEQDKYSLTLNYVRPVVDKVVRNIIGTMPGIQVMPPGVDESSRRVAEQGEALIYASWEQNQAPLVFRRLVHNMVLLRIGLLYFWWDSKNKRVSFRSIAPDNYFPVYDGEDVIACILVSRRNTRVLKKAYPDLATEIEPDGELDASLEEQRYTPRTGGMSLATEPLTGTTLVLDWYDRSGNWTRVMGGSEKAVYSANLGYKWDRLPVIEFPNNMRGDEREPGNDIEDVVELNQYLDQLVSQRADVLKRFSNPTVIDYGSGQDPRNIRDALKRHGGVIPSRKDGRLAFLNWEGLPPNFNEQIELIRSAIDDLGGQPRSAYGETATNQSGVMTNLSLTPTVMATSDKQTIVGMGLSVLNEAILRLTETFMKGEQIKVKTVAPKRPGSNTPRYYEIEMTGAEIGGWYKNRIKWPSALRTDDPMFVQSEISKMTSQPPVQSVYTTAENLGIEDVEMEIDRIKEQLEDPRFNPAGLEGAINAAGALSEVPELPPGMEGLDPGQAGVDAASMNAAAEGSGNPNRDQLVDSASDY